MKESNSNRRSDRHNNSHIGCRANPVRFPDLRDKDIAGFRWKLCPIITKEETFTLDHLDRQFPVEIMGMYWKGYTGAQVKIDNFEEFGILDQKKTFHRTFSEFPSRIQIKQFHSASVQVRVIFKTIVFRFDIQEPAKNWFSPTRSLYITTPGKCALTSVKIPTTLQKNRICRNSSAAARMANRLFLISTLASAASMTNWPSSCGGGVFIFLNERTDDERTE
jgi:hypothetical protein